MQNLKSIGSLILIGLSLGWMIGLSKSPIVSSVVSTLLTFIISILIALSGVESNEQKDALKIQKVKISLFPISIFCFFLALFGTFGVYTRSHNLLGIGIDNIEKAESNTSGKSRELNNESGFMGIPSNSCDELYLNLDNYQSLKGYLKQLNNQKINNFLKTEPDSVSLVSFSKGLCSGY